MKNRFPRWKSRLSKKKKLRSKKVLRLFDPTEPVMYLARIRISSKVVRQALSVLKRLAKEYQGVHVRELTTDRGKMEYHFFLFEYQNQGRNFIYLIKPMKNAARIIKSTNFSLLTVQDEAKCSKVRQKRRKYTRVFLSDFFGRAKGKII